MVFASGSQEAHNENTAFLLVFQAGEGNCDKTCCKKPGFVAKRWKLQQITGTIYWLKGVLWLSNMRRKVLFMTTHRKGTTISSAPVKVLSRHKSQKWGCTHIESQRLAFIPCSPWRACFPALRHPCCFRAKMPAILRCSESGSHHNAGKTHISSWNVAFCLRRTATGLSACQRLAKWACKSGGIL